MAALRAHWGSLAAILKHALRYRRRRGSTIGDRPRSSMRSGAVGSRCRGVISAPSVLCGCAGSARVSLAVHVWRRETARLVGTIGSSQVSQLGLAAVGSIALRAAVSGACYLCCNHKAAKATNTSPMQTNRCAASTCHPRCGSDFCKPSVSYCVSAKQYLFTRSRASLASSRLGDAPHVLAPRLQVVFGQAPAHVLAGDVVMFGEPDQFACQEFQRA